MTSGLVYLHEFRKKKPNQNKTNDNYYQKEDTRFPKLSRKLTYFADVLTNDSHEHLPTHHIDEHSNGFDFPSD